MPASMMMAPVGVREKVNGRSNAMVVTGPSPGSTPMSVPRNTPARHASRFSGVSAVANPSARCSPATTQSLGMRVNG